MDKLYITVAGISVVGLFLVSVLIGVTIRRRTEQVIYHTRFRPRKRLMEGPSRKCFQILIELFGHRFYVIPDVEVSALLNHKVGTQDRQTAYQLIKDRSVDFVLCNKQTMRPVCAVKLEEAGQATPPVVRAAGASIRSRLPASVRKTKAEEENAAELSRFFRSAHIPFIYLTNDKKMTSENIIEEFSRAVYDTTK